jgi:signal transduction histidine kinase
MANERILIVDDNPQILSLCSRILGAEGYDVGSASRGEDALARLNGGGFDLLLTDIRLPGHSGLEVAGKLHARGLDLTVVTMTGYSSMEMAIQALSLGVDEFIVKPFTPDDLRNTISRALEKSRLRRENARLRALLPLFENTRAFVGASTLEMLNTRIVEAIVKTIPAETIALLEISREGDSLKLAAACGKELDSHVGETILLGSPYAHRLTELSQVQVWKKEEVVGLPFDLEVPVGAAIVCTPLLSRDKQIGFLLAVVGADYARSDLEALAIVAGQAAVALENAQLIAEISTAYTELRELDRLKSEFINIVGHELRTPLSVLMGYALIMVEELTGSARERMQHIVANSERLRRIVDEMLSLRYLETGQAELQLETFDVVEALEAVVEAYRPLAEQRDQPLTLRVLGNPGKITADRAMVDLTLGNVIANAIKFSPRSSSIRVEGSGDANEISFVVRDQGPGVPASERERIFQRFYQVENSLTREHGGLGLGLAITRNMVRAHDGKIWVESEAGKGSAFHVILPRRAEAKPVRVTRSN